ncbi:GNAT family N-acetyltransferase [Mangrovibacterium lignilyticum]|uniref:GNAT family N-acetyltransferase n=1 Tax=Mangrovibacterium lignilyticum TaxID=2668052 RepID=UPI0013D7E657|nr:GNAT family N-acetyltransferase [Mangrovibacterium lignilyticum]
MDIRKAQPEDASVITEFQLAMALETENLKLNKETVSSGVEAVFADPSKGNYYITEIEGHVVASLLTTFEWSDWRNGTVLWIQSVYVLPEFRKLGIYSNMYQHIQELVMTDENLKGIRLYAEKTNDTAHLVYEKSGMSAEHYQLYEWLK